MFPMTVTVHNAAQLNAVLRAMQPDLQASGPQGPEVEANEAPAEEKPKAQETAASAPETKAAAPTPPAAKSQAAAPETKEAITYDQVRASILGVSKSKGRDAALQLLARFGVATGPELQKTPERFGEFVDAAQELIGA